VTHLRLVSRILAVVGGRRRHRPFSRSATRMGPGGSSCDVPRAPNGAWTWVPSLGRRSTAQGGRS